MNEPLRFGVNHRHTVIAEGGDNNLRYSASLSYGQNQGVMKESDRNLTNGNVRLIYRNNRLSVSNSLSIDLVNATRESIPFSDFSRANPYFRKYNALGGIDKVLDSIVFGGLTSPLQKEIYYNPVYDLQNKNVNRAESQGFTNNRNWSGAYLTSCVHEHAPVSCALLPRKKCSGLLLTLNLPA
ncbi:hypothetical protein MKQ70_26940 [Chitinophaga sedimenti]|uniref:hypothetical protein n=1 Tax=Chitinophaga sedimenti TaxID=2033606 RepID=UPI0020060D69|nr:hypothetical protein [Chitinophaga sedimenti]MCK7558437.1 hypothetical protein [Chitinophaga sedimenti]